MRCEHCGSEWTTKMITQQCPFCEANLNIATNNKATSPSKFVIANSTLIQFLGGEKDIIIPDGITKLAAGAFHGYDIETVHIPEGVVEIGNNCFNDCKKLKQVIIPASVTSISDTAFKDTLGVKIIAEKGSYAWNMFAKNNISESTKNNAIDIQQTPSIPKTTPDKSIEWAKLLDCEPGETPWINIKGSFFVSQNRRAKKLIEKIKIIYDQKLLTHIAKESNRIDVRCAAIYNITDQTVLTQLVKDSEADIRLAAIENIKDKKIIEQIALNDSTPSVRQKAIAYIDDTIVLRKIAQNDKDENVRRTAFFRIATPEELKCHLLTTNNSNDDRYVDRITIIADLLDIALSAKNEYIRIAATKKLPDNSPEGSLLKAAAAFSKGITLDGMLCYDDAQKICKNGNLEFLKKVAECHPDPCVRYLARGREKEAVRGSSFEEQMRSQTRSQREITMEKVSGRYHELCRKSSYAVGDFKKACQRQATNGNRSCAFKTKIWIDKRTDNRYSVTDDGCFYSPSDTITYSESDFFERILYLKLKAENINNAKISTYSIYERRYRDGGYHNDNVGVAYQISASW